MTETCSRVGYHDTTSFAFNVLLHILILFSILSAIYVFYISGVERDAFKSEIQSSVRDNLPKALAANDKDGQLKRTLQGAPLDKLAALYTQPEKSVTVYNTWLFRTMMVIIVAIALTTLVAGLFLYYSCNQCVPFWDILKENAIIFFFVGIIEGLFFMVIARNFIPAPPSTLVKRVFTDLSNWN